MKMYPTYKSKCYTLQRGRPWKVSKRESWKSKKNHLKYSLEISFKTGILFYEMGISFFTRIWRYLIYVVFEYVYTFVWVLTFLFHASQPSLLEVKASSK